MTPHVVSYGGVRMMVGADRNEHRARRHHSISILAWEISKVDRARIDAKRFNIREVYDLWRNSAANCGVNAKGPEFTYI